MFYNKITKFIVYFRINPVFIDVDIVELLIQRKKDTIKQFKEYFVNNKD